MLGIDTVRDVDELPDGAADLVFVCTPAARQRRRCSGRALPSGVRAAFVTSAGYGEAGPDGRRRRARARGARRRARHPARGPERPGRGVDAGASLCAQIVAPYPPAGPHRDRQPVGQLRVVVHELRRRRPASASAGRCRPATPRAVASPTTSTGTPTTPPAAVGLAYVEGVADGRGVLRRAARGRRPRSRSCS